MARRTVTATSSILARSSSPKKVSRRGRPRKIDIETRVADISSNSPFSYRPNLNRKTAILLLTVAGLLLLSYALYKYLVIAWVDQTPITRVQLYKEMEKKYAKDINDQLVTQQLIMNEARRRGVMVTNEEINAQIKKIEEQVGGTERFNQIMEAQGLTLEEVKQQIKFPLLGEKMFGNNLQITEEELNDFISKNKDILAQNGESTDSAQVINEAREQLKQQKVGKLFGDWITEAKQSNRVRKLRFF